MGNFLVLLAAIAWSTAGLFTRVVSTDFPTTLFWRSLFGGLCVLLIYYVISSPGKRRRVLLFSRGELVIAIAVTAGMLCFISSFFYTSVANVSFIYGLMPLSTLVLSILILKETTNKTSLLCCTVSMLGVAFIMWGVKDASDKLGLLLAFGMTFFMALLTIATKYYPSAEVAKSTYLSAFICTLIIWPFSSQSDISVHDYYWLIAYGLTNVGLGFGVYLLGVSRTTAISAALIGLTEIPLAPILAWLLFSEVVSLRTLSGGAIIMLATVIYLLHPQSKK
ncbi:DMT family transporter [Marinomonas sp.]|nr:DMT family transporter [Marinomonas sp.]MDB4837856.1 DMT family transporter [Marinomonas sp.]